VDNPTGQGVEKYNIQSYSTLGMFEKWWLIHSSQVFVASSLKRQSVLSWWVKQCSTDGGAVLFLWYRYEYRVHLHQRGIFWLVYYLKYGICHLLPLGRSVRTSVEDNPPNTKYGVSTQIIQSTCSCDHYVIGISSFGSCEMSELSNGPSVTGETSSRPKTCYNVYMCF
jgi:hypothetical protein